MSLFKVRRFSEYYCVKNSLLWGPFLLCWRRFARKQVLGASAISSAHQYTGCRRLSPCVHKPCIHRWALITLPITDPVPDRPIAFGLSPVVEVLLNAISALVFAFGRMKYAHAICKSGYQRIFHSRCGDIFIVYGIPIWYGIWYPDRRGRNECARCDLLVVVEVLVSL